MRIYECCTEVKAQKRPQPTLTRGSPAGGGECRQHVETCVTHNSVQKVAGARVLYQTNPCEIGGGQSDTETPFCPSTWFYPVSTIPPMFHTRPVPAFFLTKGQAVEA